MTDDPQSGQTAPLLHVELARRHESERARRRPAVALVLYHRDGARVVPVDASADVTVGRAAPSDVVVRDPSLSRQHARFVLRGDTLWVEDLGSTNGTRINGQVVDAAAVEPGDELALGSVFAAIELQRPGQRVDGVEGHETFLIGLEGEVARARTYGRALGLLVVRSDREAGRPASQWCSDLRRLLRPFDRVALYDARTVEVLAPELALTDLRALAERALGEIDPEGALRCGVGMFPVDARTAEELVDVVRGAALEADATRPVLAASEDGSGVRAVVASRGDAQADGEGRIVRSAAMRVLYDTARKAARSRIPVLLLGQTGTGKELLARSIHEESDRAARPLICVNCAALPEQLVESTLFGHERGAFTGATQRAVGVFESADGGTVFLDEVGELPPPAQAALLRVLEEQRFTRVGSTREVEVDVRVVAATHRDLEAMAARGEFREDLLYRLNAITLQLPPLSERTEEIPALAQHFVALANARNGCDVRGVSAGAMALLGRYEWPGNVRELRNAIERAVVLAHDEVVTEEDLPQRVRAVVTATPAAPARRQGREEAVTAMFRVDGGEPTPVHVGLEQPTSPGADDGDGEDHDGADGGDADADADLKDRVRRYEADLILDALRESDWNRREAAERLGLPVRTLTHKMSTLGIKRSGYAITDEE